MILCRALSYEENTLDKSLLKRKFYKNMLLNTGTQTSASTLTMAFQERPLLRLDSDTFYINHVTAVMVDNLRRLLLGINLSDKAIMDFDFPGVGFPV